MPFVALRGAHSSIGGSSGGPPAWWSRSAVPPVWSPNAPSSCSIGRPSLTTDPLTVENRLPILTTCVAISTGPGGPGAR